MEPEQTTTPSSTDDQFTEAEQLVFALDKARVPPLYRDATWDTFVVGRGPVQTSDKWPPLFKKLDELLEWRGDETAITTAFLCGQPGCGKTHLAAATVHRWIAAGRPGALFIVVGELLASLRRGFNDGTAAGSLDQAKYAKLLVLDDIGSEMATDWVRDTLYMLINYRMNHLKPTLITSNLFLSEISQRYHARLASRLAGGLAIDMSLLKDHRVVR
jgi:chromosomal replication initiation ATPase DnaA